MQRIHFPGCPGLPQAMSKPLQWRGMADLKDAGSRKSEGVKVSIREGTVHRGAACAVRTNRTAPDAVLSIERAGQGHSQLAEKKSQPGGVIRAEPMRVMVGNRGQGQVLA
jgi:hypothetical protein